MSTRREPGSPDPRFDPFDRFFLSAALISLFAASATFFLRSRLISANPRIVYGLHRLPAAFLAIAFCLLLTAILHPALTRISSLEDRPASLYAIAITAIFGLVWLPAWWAGGFVQDDWLLLAAASVRKIIYLHPTYSWYTLDSVDGNFRPLGTVLYFGYMLKAFGPAARAFTFGPLLLIWLAALVAFAVAREMGHSKIAAAAAALLFLSRGMLYTVVLWASALGDAIAILFCGLTALFILKASKRHGVPALLLHLLAWLSFTLALLGKQSAFVTPLIVALLLLLRPGEQPRPPLRRHAPAAIFALLAYAATAAVVFRHAKSLLRAPSPYPIDFSFQSLFHTFAYATWYFVILRFPDRFPAANLLPPLIGLGIVAGLVLLARRFPTALGNCPHDILFACLAAAASLSLFIVLGTRSAAYYGSMAAFWFSIALAIVLTRTPPPDASATARLAPFVFYLLLVTGFAEIRLEQTGLFPSGGYIWGTYGMDTERSIHADMRTQLAAAVPAETLLLTNCPYANPYAPMALLDSPNLSRIIFYDARTGRYIVNDQQGLRPEDGFANLNDPGAYNWRLPLDPANATQILAQSKVLPLECRNGHVERASQPRPRP